MAKPRLLIVDDDQDLALFMSSIALEMGFQVECCDNPKDLRSAYRNDLTAVIVDMVMPEMDGVEVIRFLAEQQCHAGIILVSSLNQRILSSGENLIQGRELQLVGSLQKPFVPDNLTALLTKARLASSARRLYRHPLSNQVSRTPTEEELVVLFQPKINLQTLDFCSVEALVRWQHPEKGLLGPGFFIPRAEEDGSIDQITEIVLQKTLAQCNKWMKDGLVLEVSINISRRSLSNVNLPDQMIDSLMCYNISPSQVVLEITETWLNEDPVNCLDTLMRLSLKGFRISIDDFGTGYSSIAQLSRIPFSELKIDQSFVKHAPTNLQARKILESSVELGHHLDLKVVAEGVETQEQWDVVVDTQCDECQGFFIARPLPGDSTPAWLQRWLSMQGHDSNPSKKVASTTLKSAIQLA